MRRTGDRAATNASVEQTKGELLRNLRGLRVLEGVQTLLAIGAFVVIAVRAAVETQDAEAKLAIALALLLALTYLALAFRIRAGAELVRRDLWLLEAGRVGSPSDPRADADAHPYRTLSPEVLCAGHDTRAFYSRGPRLASYAAIAALASGATLAVVAVSRG